MERSTVDENGCVTVPATIREALNLHAGAVLDWHVMPDGVVLVRPKTKSIKDLAGLLRANALNVVVDVDDMSPWWMAEDTNCPALENSKQSEEDLQNDKEREQTNHTIP
ncbi:AbrB/MazE/SpoVT family DNA-binding domain-containing protein [Paraburkholderia sp. SIMBA_049]